jgi:hypothetical protein
MFDQSWMEMSLVEIKIWPLVYEQRIINYANVTSAIVLLNLAPRMRTSATTLCTLRNLVASPFIFPKSFFFPCLAFPHSQFTVLPPGSQCCQHHTPHYTQFHKHQSPKSASRRGGSLLFCGRNMPQPHDLRVFLSSNIQLMELSFLALT